MCSRPKPGSSIASATGGQYYQGVQVSQIVDVIKNAIIQSFAQEGRNVQQFDQVSFCVLGIGQHARCPRQTPRYRAFEKCAQARIGALGDPKERQIMDGDHAARPAEGWQGEIG